MHYLRNRFAVRRRVAKRPLGVAATFTALVAMLVLTSMAGASLSPTTAFFELLPGTGVTETGKQVTLAAQPGAADVEIAIDTTGAWGRRSPRRRPTRSRS